MDRSSPHRRKARIRRAPPELKLGGAVAAVVGIVLLDRNAWWAFGAAALVLLALAVGSRVPLRGMIRRLLLLEPFAISMALLSLFQEGGLWIFLGTLCKSTLCLGCMILLSATTRFSDLMAVLIRVRIPRLLVTTLALTHRYLFLLFDESTRMLRARRSRSFKSDRWWAWRSSATVAAQLFIRSSERAERVHAAMCARGWW